MHNQLAPPDLSAYRSGAFRTNRNRDDGIRFAGLNEEGVKIHKARMIPFDPNEIEEPHIRSFHAEESPWPL